MHKNTITALQTLKDHENLNPLISQRQTSAVDMLSEIQSLIMAEEVRNKHRTIVN
jgi:hypothetical protein